MLLTYIVRASVSWPGATLGDLPSNSLIRPRIDCLRPPRGEGLDEGLCELLNGIPPDRLPGVGGVLGGCWRL